MKRFGIALSLALMVGAGIALPGTGPVSAQSGGGYDLSWSTIDGGGKSAGGSYTLGGTMGQPDAGTSSGGSYSLSGGFWLGGSSSSNGDGGGGSSPASQQIYLPLIIR